jgi:hypothetical protein
MTTIQKLIAVIYLLPSEQSYFNLRNQGPREPCEALFAHANALSRLEDLALRLDRRRDDNLNVLHFFQI